MVRTRGGSRDLTLRRGVVARDNVFKVFFLDTNGFVYYNPLAI